METLASRDETTVVTCVRRRTGITLAHFEPKTLSERIEDECERLCWTYGASDWLVTTSQSKAGWVASAVLSKFVDGEQTLVAVVASKPRESREMADYEVLGRLFIVGE